MPDASRSAATAGSRSGMLRPRFGGRTIGFVLLREAISARKEGFCQKEAQSDVVRT